MLKIFRILPKSLAADVFSYLDMENQHSIITKLSDKGNTLGGEMGTMIGT